MGLEAQVRTLSYAVRPAVVVKYLGQLSLALAALSLVPSLAALVYGDPEFALRGLAMALACVGLGLPASRLQGAAELQANEALVITAGAFIGASLITIWPLMSAGLSFGDAWLEAISAVTTTGLTTLRGMDRIPESVIFDRAWMQWYGGLGIVVLGIALALRPGAVARRLMGPELAVSHLSLGGAKTHAKRMLTVYLALTLGGTILLWALWGDAERALVHTLAAVSTGGFAAFDDSLASAGTAVQVGVTLVALSGAVALPVYYRAFTNGASELRRDPQLAGLLLAALAATVLLGLFMLAAGRPWPEVLHHAPLLALSAQTTAGFSTLPIADLDSASKLSLILSMAVGGDVGSTAGGFKILRLLIVLRILQLVVLRTRLSPHAVAEPRLGASRLLPADVEGAFVLVLLYALMILLSWLPFLVLGYPPLDALFEVVSAVATCGLSTGITATGLAAGLKLVLGMDMLFGRLEILALLVVLYPGTWVGKRTSV